MINILFGGGLFSLPWWGYALLALSITHVTIACVTLYLHRGQTHRAIILSPAVSHVMRFWLWLNTGMVTKEWVAVHRKHHHVVETEHDPHSPRHQGLLNVLFKGTEMYRNESVNKETLKVYGQGTPRDWLERNLYAKRTLAGIILLFVIQYILFGLGGITVWAVQMMWIPFFAAGVINGAGHAVGYRNFDTPDDSTNLVNFGIIIGGEELHNNHHAFPGSAKFSLKPWEFDIGWVYIKILQKCKLAVVRQVASPKIQMPQNNLDLEAAKILFRDHVHVMAEYINAVMRPIFFNELSKAKTQINDYNLLKKAKHAFFNHRTRIRLNEHKKLEEVLHANQAMQTAYEFKHLLQTLWHAHRNDHEKLKEALLEWCSQAEETGLVALKDFALRMKGTKAI